MDDSIQADAITPIIIENIQFNTTTPYSNAQLSFEFTNPESTDLLNLRFILDFPSFFNQSTFINQDILVEVYELGDSTRLRETQSTNQKGSSKIFLEVFNQNFEAGVSYRLDITYLIVPDTIYCNIPFPIIYIQNSDSLVLYTTTLNYINSDSISFKSTSTSLTQPRIS